LYTFRQPVGKAWVAAAGLAALLSGAGAPVRFDLAGTDGVRHGQSEFGHSRAVVLVFIATDCPISNRYSPLLHGMASEYGAKGAPFLAVFSDAAVSMDAVKKYVTDYSLGMPGLLDPGASLARQTGARVTPEVVVLSPGGAVLYRGRIDNRYVDWGKTRPEATEQDLREALDAVLAGKPVLHPVTPALGCAITGVS
jgi:thiol-disulfide isomerase/thioredoxin